MGNIIDDEDGDDDHHFGGFRGEKKVQELVMHLD